MSGSVVGLGAFHRHSDAVFGAMVDPVTVGPAQIAALVDAARAAPAGRARLLLHPGVDDSLHEMVIALPFHSCDHPHINFVSAKSFVALSGRFAVMTFDEEGEPRPPIILDAQGAGAGGRLVRLQGPVWHTIIPLAGDTVFLETILGPFRGNRFAPWFPDAAQPLARDRAADELRRIARTAAGIS